MAVKVIRLGQRSSAAAVLEAELQVLCRLHHPRVLILMGISRDLPSESLGSLALVTEHMTQGSLFHVLHETDIETEGGTENKPVPLSQKLQWARDIADGMRFLHHSGLIHRDLKTANVLVDEAGRCKIADFGMSKFREQSMSHVTGMVGTVAWTAPEVLLGGAMMYQSADVYSYGVILWELLTGQVPWEGCQMPQIIIRVAVQHETLTFPASSSAPAAAANATAFEMQNLAQACFGPPDARPSFDVLFVTLQQLLLDQKRAEDQSARACPATLVCPICHPRPSHHVRRLLLRPSVHRYLAGDWRSVSHDWSAAG